MEKQLIIERLRTIAAAVSKEAGLDLVHVEIAGTKRDSVLRIYIDKDGGVTIEDCTNVSRGIEEILDAEDLIPSRYVLEVSSPGIERELYSIEDFKRFTGRLAKIKARTGIEGQKTFVGLITSVDDDLISIEDRTRGTVALNYSDVDKANLKIDLSKEFGRK